MGGATPYKWKLVSGTLPRHLKLKRDGVLHGTPKLRNVSPGTFTFTVQASTHGSRGHPTVTTTETLTLTLL
jgi:hypothetical protein